MKQTIRATAAIITGRRQSLIETFVHHYGTGSARAGLIRGR